MAELSKQYNGYTGEQVVLVRTLCECGHSLSFISNKPRICRHCGTLVFPTKESEFKFRLNKEMRKRK